LEEEERGRQRSRLTAEAERHRVAAWLLVRVLAAIHLVAFASLRVQLDGLIGDQGILPARELLQWAERLGPKRFWLLPTLAWISPGQGMLHLLCGAGMAIAALLLVYGILPNASLLALWALYLSLCTVAQDFLGFQWDVLLLETTLLAAFLPRWRLRHRLADAPNPVFLWMLRWLLFRLMVASGAVKLSSGDPTWKGLTALLVHYETQPLPTVLGWWAHQLPAWFQKLSCAVMLVVELAVPFLIFCGRRGRLLAFGALVGFQILIAATGNYAFFNLLTIALCLLLLPDNLFPRRFRREPTAAPPAHRLSFALAALLLVASLPPFAGSVGLRIGPLGALTGLLGPLRSVNSYGLFAMMTTTRPEIVIEGSDDGTSWLAYELPYKPGDLSRAPRWVAPHQPRLDWQLWFAALGAGEPWFSRLVERLLSGTPDVLALFARNPFPAAPPRWIRASMYQYRFTSRAERNATGAWWKREPKGLYYPTVSLRGVREQMMVTP